MTIGYGDLRKGMAIELDGEPAVVVEYERSKMQQRAPVMRIRFRDIRSGRVVDRTFQGYDVKLTPANVDRRSSQYIYDDEGLYYFMDNETFEQFPIASDQISDALPYLSIQLTVDLVFFQDQAIAIDLPITVDLKVVDEKGDEVPAGMSGELCISGPNVVHGYWNNPEQTAAAFPDGASRLGCAQTLPLLAGGRRCTRCSHGA